MIEYHFPLSVVHEIMGGIDFMYEFMHVCKNVCISLYTYVGVHACICVRLANNLVNVKTKTKIFDLLWGNTYFLPAS